MIYELTDHELEQCLKILLNLKLKGSIVLADNSSTKFIHQIKDSGGNPCIPCSNSYVERWRIVEYQ